MFRKTKPNRHNRRPRNVRARDGRVRLTSAERRRICKLGGMTKRELSRSIKEDRAYKKGRKSYRGRSF